MATAKKNDRYDAYDYTFTGEFSGLKLEENMDRDKWNELAQQAAEIVETGKPAVAATVAASVEGTEVAAELSEGLFLLIPRNKDATDKKDYIDDRAATAEESKQNPARDRLRYSTADSKLYTYQFAPQLVALPSKADLTSKDQTISTADPGDWITELTVYLKPEREDLKLDLKIIKSLTEFVGPANGASFVFRITAVKEIEGQEKPETVSRVVMMNFTDAGEKTVTLEKFAPVGSKVTVEELYDGKSYHLVDSTEMPITAVADAPLEAKFTNSPGEDFKPGQGVVNHFIKDASGDWPWEQLKDESDKNG